MPQRINAGEGKMGSNPPSSKWTVSVYHTAATVVLDLSFICSLPCSLDTSRQIWSYGDEVSKKSKYSVNKC